MEEIRDYEYAPLQLNEIRLLKLLPSPDNEAVSCILGHFSIENLPEYAALSYAWGTDLVQFPVIVNDRLLTVNSNLHAALQEFRARPVWHKSLIAKTDPHDAHHFIWIDAICINQKNLAERAEQVKLMRYIYIQASCLTVWLGTATSDSGIALSALRRLNSIPKGPIPGKEDAAILQIFSPSDQEWIAIKNLMQNPYFSRSWVVQEYSLGGILFHGEKGLLNAVRFCCGTEQIGNLVDTGWDAASLAALMDPRPLSNPWFDIVNRIVVLQTARRVYQNMLLHEQAARDSSNLAPSGFQPTLAFLLLSHSKTLSSEPRDKIYSILGLAEEVRGSYAESYAPNELIIDYAAITQDVYSSSVRSVVLATGRLDILGAAYKEKPSLIERSWSPDWTCPIMSIPLYTLKHKLYFQLPHEVNLDSSPDVKSSARFASDLSSLTVSGLSLGSLTHVSSWVIDPSGPTASLRNRFRTIAKFLGGQSPFRQENPWDRIAEVLILYLATYSLNNHLFAAARSGWSDRLREWICDEREEELASSLDRKRASLLGDVMFMVDQEVEFTEETLLVALLMTASTTPIIGAESIIVSSNGHVGRSSNRVREGDLLCILLGCARPMVLRPVENHFELIGEAFMPSVIGGKAIEEWKEGKWTLRDFELH